MRLGAFKLKEPLPELKEPHALVMLQPWIDVGSVGSLTLAWLESYFKAKELASLARPGDFFDFTRYRPTSYFRKGHRQVMIPNSYATFGQQKAGNDFLFIHLLEPHSHSEIYIDSILRLLAKFDVKRYCLLGSMYDYVPHTKPLVVTGGGTGKGTQQELEALGISPGNYQGPTTITLLISQQAPDLGIETMSLIVHLPQYAQLDDNHIGAARLMEILSSMYNLPADKAYLEKAERQMEQINLAVEGNPQLKTAIERLESQYEAQNKRRRRDEEPSQLSPAVEKFLSEMERRFREN